MKTVSGVFVLAGVLLAGCGVSAEECYGPMQNLSKAYEPGAIGCSCQRGQDADVCVRDPAANRNVALVCEGGRWLAVEDGPCMPSP